MKHTLVLLASLLAVAGSVALSVNVHRAEVQHQFVLDARAAAVHAQQIAQQQLQAHQTVQQLRQARTDVQRLQEQCVAGVRAYNLLSPSQAKLNHVVKPDCSIQ